MAAGYPEPEYIVPISVANSVLQVGLASYAFNKKYRNEDMTVAGATTAVGGVGTICVGAAVVGILGNLVWRPGFAAINTSGQFIASNQ